VSRGKRLGRDLATPARDRYSAANLSHSVAMSAIPVANRWGDARAYAGRLPGGPYGERGDLVCIAELIARTAELPGWHVGKALVAPHGAQAGRARTADRKDA